jgi:ABC-2 type transport system ATP-binding protein
MQNILEISELCKSYNQNKDSKEILKNINLNIKAGSFFGLLGVNGAGKSTLINIIAGIVRKTSGSIKICGLDIDKEPEKIKQLVGIVPQEIVYDVFSTVRETLENYAGYFGIDKSRRKTEEIIEAIGLTKQANFSTRKLSGGMKRRLLIGKALVNQPKLLFLDEPTAGVDIELREHLWKYFKKLNDTGTTIVLTTHYLEEAELLCNDIALIDHGRIVLYQKKEELFSSFVGKIIEVQFEEKITQENIKKIGFKVDILSDHRLKIYYSDERELNKLMKFQKSNLTIVDIKKDEIKLENIIKDILLKQRLKIT